MTARLGERAYRHRRAAIWRQVHALTMDDYDPRERRIRADIRRLIRTRYSVTPLIHNGKKARK